MNLATFFKLIRWKNLVMLAAIQLLFKYIYFPTFSIDTALNHFDFSVLVLATICIAAAGYIINDVYDIEADKINKPSKVFVSNAISIKKAMSLYYVLNGIGFLAGIYVSYRIDNLSFISIFIITALLLKVYNSDLKNYP